MSIMGNRGSMIISTNIERDSNVDINYIVTANSDDLYKRIIFNYLSGHHCFNLIGSYGTGKSSFLWALDKHLQGDRIFSTSVENDLTDQKEIKVLKFVGSTVSFKETFYEKLEGEPTEELTNKDVLKHFSNVLARKANKNTLQVIFIDEFGKYLEFAAKNDFDEMYFLQELAEFCGRRDIILITTLHQNFGAYSKGLTSEQKNEWNKVKGRFLDLAFDEPIEQLLFFASEKLGDRSSKGITQEQFAKINASGLISKMSELDLYSKLYPLDPLNAHVLTAALQKYGQNERSLFSFLSSVELEEAIKNESFFTVDSTFDYLVKYHAAEIQDGEINANKPIWNACFRAIEKAEFLFEDSFQEISKLLKSLALVNIFGKTAGNLDQDFFSWYLSEFSGVNNAGDLIDELVKKRIIIFSKHRNKYVFLDGTDLDLEHELLNASKYVNQVDNVVERVKAYLDFPVIPAKRIQFKKGTPRYFEFVFSDEIINTIPEKEIDGFINVVFSSNIKKGEIESLPTNVVVLVSRVDELKETLFQIDKIKYVIDNFSEDKAALRILNEELSFQNKQLKEGLLDEFFSPNGNNWFFPHEGRTSKIQNFKELNSKLSTLCEKVFDKVPTYLNEMVNKEYASTAILTARKALIKKLIENGDKEDIGFEAKKFPPEKTIYLSLLKATGIHVQHDGVYSFKQPSDESFLPLWETSMNFINDSKNGKRNISELYSSLSQSPYKLKMGFLDLWIPIFLIINKENYSLYSQDGGYIPHLTPDVMDLIHKKPANYLIKGLNTTGIQTTLFNQYKELVGYNESNVKGLESSYITIYSNFLRFYRSLPEYTQQTKNLSAGSKKVRDAIAKAKDPETALFKDIPAALGIHDISNDSDEQISAFITNVTGSINELREAYDMLINRIEEGVSKFLKIKTDQFSEIKEEILKVYSKVNRSLLNPELKVFYNRLVSPLDDRASYYKSLADHILKKPVEKMKDEEEVFLIENISESLKTLLSLVDIHKLSSNKNDVIQFTVLNQSGKIDAKESIILNEETIKEAKEIESKVSEIFKGADANTIKLALINLLGKKYE